jgi:hypothetical protein
MKRLAEIAPESIHEPYWFSKDKLPRTLSYPLKRSLLDAALRSASVFETVYSMRYLRGRNDCAVLEATFHPEQSRDFGAGKVLITVWAVEGHERQAAEQLLLAEGLPALCRWLTKMRAEGNVWRGARHGLTLKISGGKLRTSSDDTRTAC